MARLPSAEKAEVSRRKVFAYLLNPEHPDGWGKAAFFTRFGFSRHAWKALAAALRNHVLENDVASVVKTPLGVRYVIEGPIEAPNGRTPMYVAFGFKKATCRRGSLRHILCLRRLNTIGMTPREEIAQMIRELDRVVLATDLPKEGLQAGDIGTVVLVHGDAEGYEVEFTTLDGNTFAVVTVLAGQVRPAKARELAHARLVH